jgi:hypothetical protein
MSQTASPDVNEALEAEPAGPDQPVYQVNFWRKPWVQQVLPWATSLGVHIAIISVALALLATGALMELIPRLTQPQVNVPTTELAETNIGGVPNVGNMDDVTSPNAQLEPVEQTRNPLPAGEGNNIEALMESGSAAAADGITGITGVGSLAEALGGGGGEGSTIFGEPGGGGRFIGFDIGRTGDGGAVTRVVFVCDASGSMEGRPKLLLIGELKETLGTLKPIQFFNVIFFQWDSYAAAYDDGLKPGSPRFKQQTYDFLDRLSVRGSTNPIPALEAAFRMKPQLIFFLTDGRFDQNAGYEEVLETIRRLNGDKETMINTIQFINRDETAEGVLRTIAAENGGEYKFIDEDDL